MDERPCQQCREPRSSQTGGREPERAAPAHQKVVPGWLLQPAANGGPRGDGIDRRREVADPV
jgi:hypothetical protein